MDKTKQKNKEEPKQGGASFASILTVPMSEEKQDKQGDRPNSDTNKKSPSGWRGQQSSKGNVRVGGTFKGATDGMNGHVFQTAAEQSKRRQFQRTLEELQVYLSVTFKRETHLLGTLFEDLETPVLTKPVKPTSTDDVDADLYKEEVKLYVQEKKNMQATLSSIFNVVWGQCSPIMKSNL